MSTGGRSGRRSIGSGRLQPSARPYQPLTALTPENNDTEFEPCAATASYFLYAQRNVVLVLNHDSLTIERRLQLHKEDVVWIAVDNASERRAGRLAVSYDAGNTAIVWDLQTGGEIARFSAYEKMKSASFMRNGNIAFGNEQGNIILFEPSTSEHISARTIFDPITALAPAADCRTFAIGYANGSILIATLQPSFTILHTLTTTRAPSPITGLSWHGSSSKQKTDMLATQTQDGDLRVWSVPKPGFQESPTIIRVLQRAETLQTGPCWFAWSKNGRIVQHAEGETRSWDVRTKKVSWEVVPTVDGIRGITSYGPNATLFTLGRNHTIAQYDINPNDPPVQVATAQHVPAKPPPTPPPMLDELRDPYESSSTISEANHLPSFTDTGESSADESGPLKKIAREMESLDALESELRDVVMPLSPSSSRASSVSSASSGPRGRRGRRYLYDKPDSSRASSTTGAGTEFSLGAQSVGHGRTSMSIRSVSSMASASGSRHRTSSIRNQVPRSPQDTKALDLFPYTRERLRNVPLRTPHYGNTSRTPDLLQREMLSVIFGWNDTARSLIRDEMQRHKAGSACGVLLSKWLGDMAADDMASMIGSESMTSSDWMLLALSNLGADSQKKIGEAFVQRLLEKGDIHPAVAILVGLGETNDAIEVYVSQNHWLEAVLLTCLTCPSDWQRISYLIKKWGEAAVKTGDTELAVRCFSCNSIETTEPWFSPRAQDAAFTAQQERFGQPLASPPLSPPSRSGSTRLAAKNASLRLITTFGDKGIPVALDTATPMHALGVTPIAQSALSPMAPNNWQQTASRMMRDPSSARTATPGGYSRKKRLPSRGDIARAKEEAATMATPITAAREIVPPMPKVPSRRASSVASMNEPTTAVKPNPSEGGLDDPGRLPSPTQGAFTRLAGGRTRERNSDGLSVQVMDTRYNEVTSPGPGTGTSRGGAISPAPLTGASTKSAKTRAINEYISSVEEARELAREKRAQSKRRGESRRRDESQSTRASSRARDLSETRSQGNVRFIKPAKRSPSSPVPMSPAEIAQASAASHAAPATSEDESFYKMISPVDSHKSLKSSRSEPRPRRRQVSPGPSANEDSVIRPQPRSRAASRQRTEGDRGRSNSRQAGSRARSPPSPVPMPADSQLSLDQDEGGLRLLAASSVSGSLQSRRAESRERRDTSTNRRAGPLEDLSSNVASNLSKDSVSDGLGSLLSTNSSSVTGRSRGLSRKETAAKELEQRRLSLARRRPSAPYIPHPDEVQIGAARPALGQRSNTELGNSPSSYMPPMSRSQTVDPEQMMRHSKITGTSTVSVPIGLPATPRAMRHPRYMSTDPNERDGTPPVPEMPDNASNLSSLGSSLSQASAVSNSYLGSGPSHLTSNLTSNYSHETSSTLSSQASHVSKQGGVATAEDDIGPLLPSTVFGQKGQQAPPARAASAPPEKMGGGGIHPAYKSSLQFSRRLSHVRKISPPESGAVDNGNIGGSVTSIDQALASSNDQHIVIIPDHDDIPPPILPQLQHLAGPPPPPPPPPPPFSFGGQPNGQRNGSGVISITMDENAPPVAIEAPMTLPSTTYPQPMDRATTTSPQMHRRGRGSVNETFGSRFRGIGERMRSTSRGAHKSSEGHQPMPYESILPPVPHQQQRIESEFRAKSPYEKAMAAQVRPSQDQIPPPPPPPPAPPLMGMEGKLQETVIPPPRSQSAAGGYRNPKEIRANMPPELLQQGVYHGNGGFL